MKSHPVSRSESKHHYVLNEQYEENPNQKQDRFYEAFKLCPILSKLEPIYRKPVSRILPMGIALFLCLGLIQGPLFAADFLQPPATSSSTPVIAVDSTTVDATEVQPQTADAPADAFILAGPLSSATPTTTPATSSTLLPLASTVTPTRSLYVSTTGSDTGTGAQDSAWRSIGYAVSQLKAGDTLFVQEGIYQQTGGGAVFRTSGTAAANITIQGVGHVVIEGTATTTISGYTVAANYNPAFDTGGQDYINFKDFTVNNLRAAVKVSANSSYINIDSVNADRNHFGVLIDGGDHVSVRNMTVTNSRNGFRTESTKGVIPTDILFENINVSGSKDVYTGFETKYRNGDGFILESGNRITVRNVVSRDNWDGGFDIKAVNVLLEYVEVYGNKNNFKIWGSGIVVKNSLIHDAKILTTDPISGEGWGVNNRGGSVRFINTTFANNENADIRTDNQVGTPTTVLENCVIVRNISSGKLYEATSGSLTEGNNIWFDATKPAGFTLGITSRFIDPKFVSLSGKDYHLTTGSPAIDFGSTAYAVTVADYENKTRVVGSSVDAGAYEFQGIADTTAPVIRVVASTNVTAIGATINWTTNEVSDSQVEYRLQGATTWLASNVDSTMATNHAIFLSGLTSSSVYEFRVKSKDQAGNMAVQAVIDNFSTLAPPDTTAPVISVVATSNLTVSGATIHWTTNEVSDSQVEYRLQGTTTWLASNVDPAMTINHAMVLSGLNASAAYEFRVKSTDQAGNMAIQAVVDNFSTLAPPDTTAPVISVVATSNLTVSGATIGWTTNEVSDSQVEYRLQGSTTWLATSVNLSMVTNHSMTLSGLNASAVYEFRAKSKDQAGNLATQATVSTFTTATPVIVCTTAMCGVTAGQTVKGTIIIQPNLTLNPDIRKVSYYLNGTTSGKEYSSPFTWGGIAGFDTTKLANGTYTLGGAYTTSAGDQSFTINFVVNTGVVDTTAPVISAVAASNPTANGATINWATNEAGDSQIEYRLQGSTTWSATAVNTLMVTNHSMTLSGLNSSAVYEFRVKSKDQAGNLATQATVSSFTTSIATTTCTTAICGVTAGQTVGGTIKVQPNLTLSPDIRKVAYYLNGTLVSREYTSPFIMNGGAGLDTTKMVDGVYTLSGAYTTNAGDQNFSVTFTVKNTVPQPTTTCTTAICGVTNSQTLSGTVLIQPNLTMNPDVRKVSYYLNGTLYSREYTSPFTLGGTAGLDTKKLANGTYVLTGAYTTALGDVPFTISFTVKN